MTEGRVSNATAPNADDTAVEQLSIQLRRRREASWRLPMMEDGRRDPVSRFVG